MIDLYHSGIRNFIKKYSKSFSFAFIIFIILWKINLLNYLGNYTIGGGAILKLNYLIEKNNFLLLLFFSSIGFSILAKIVREDFKNNFVILLPIFVIYCFPY